MSRTANNSMSLYISGQDTVKVSVKTALFLQAYSELHCPHLSEGPFINYITIHINYKSAQNDLLVPVSGNPPGTHHISPIVLHWKQTQLLVVARWLYLAPVQCNNQNLSFCPDLNSNPRGEGLSGWKSWTSTAQPLLSCI